MTFIMEGIIDSRNRMLVKGDRGIVLQLRQDILVKEETFITSITAAMVRKAFNKKRNYPSIERFKRECHLYMVHIDHNAIAQDMQKSAAEEKGEEYVTEENEMFQAALKEHHEISVHFPLDTQDKVEYLCSSLFY